VLSFILISGLLLFRLNLSRLDMFFLDDPDWFKTFMEERAEQIEGSFGKIVRFGIPVVICYTFVDRPLRLALGAGAILLVFHFVERSDSDILLQERSFFGVLKVERADQFHKLMHGTTLHGTQRYDYDQRTRAIGALHFSSALALASTDPIQASTYLLGAEAAYWMGEQPEWLDPRREALTYYHRTGPVGQLMRAFRGPDKRKPHFAVIGLGTGTMASYGEPGQKLTYYDIDKHVVDIASNDTYFTYLKDARARGVDIDIALGDARVELKKAVQDSNHPRHNDRYGIMVIDAFSSDAIPVHLITLEAIEKYYWPMLDEGGVLAFHISNRHLDLEPVLGNLADKLKLKAVVQNDGREEGHPEKAASTWVLLARDVKDFGDLPTEYRTPWREGSELQSFYKELPDVGFWSMAATRALAAQRPRWFILKGDPKVGIWTDDFSNLLSVFNWK
jgi:hypothetical protein